jgi:hypothetical protein
MDAEFQACGAVARERPSLSKDLDDMSLLCADFPAQGPVAWLRNNQAVVVGQGPEGGSAFQAHGQCPPLCLGARREWGDTICALSFGGQGLLLFR